jgi:hypothetical protein
MKKLILACSLLTFFFSVKGQIGGDNVYEFINLAPSARVTALGGNLITVMDDDINLAFANPGLLNPSMHHQLAFNHNFHLADIQHGYAAFGQHIDSWNTTFQAGMQYVSYGAFQRTDEFGNINGDFKAGEYAFLLGAGKELYERLSVGANLKMISSQFEGYDSWGMLGDVSAVFKDTAQDLTLTLLFKNIGGQFTTYADTREDGPFEIQAGISKKLKYLPFRFSIIYHNLQRWNITYDDPNSEEAVTFLGDPQDTGNDNFFIDNLFRHFIFNGEFLFGKYENFRLRFGYNHLLRKEMIVGNYRSLHGFTFGLGLKINRFRIDYGRGNYHLVGGLNHFSISTNLSEFSSKKLID